VPTADAPAPGASEPPASRRRIRVCAEERVRVTKDLGDNDGRSLKPGVSSDHARYLNRSSRETGREKDEAVFQDRGKGK
jgi:hypothetical protein